MDEEQKNRRYVVIHKESTKVAASGLKSRKLARTKKRELEEQYRQTNGFRPTPSQYFVETDIDHPAGAGIYSH